MAGYLYRALNLSRTPPGGFHDWYCHIRHLEDDASDEPFNKDHIRASNDTIYIRSPVK